MQIAVSAPKLTDPDISTTTDAIIIKIFVKKFNMGFDPNFGLTQYQAAYSNFEIILMTSMNLFKKCKIFYIT